MPIPPPAATAPYAYVVDYRPLDACAPPSCRIAGSKLEGWWDEVQNDGGRGAYARIGEPRSEVYFRRAKVIRQNQVYEFELSPESGEFEYDGYFAALGGREWTAHFEVMGAGGKVLYAHDLAGTTKQVIDARVVQDMAHYDDYYGHIRLKLPAREQALHVRISNAGATSLAIGSPLVLRKVVGRAARQAIFVLTDSVPGPLLTHLFSGKDDAQSAWLGRAVHDRGTLFSRGISPAFNTPTFARRFFRAGFYETDGEMDLFGYGIDEQAPATPPTPVARLAEQGFQTEFTVANFFLMPNQTRIGFDGGYQNEQQAGERLHPAAIVHRFSSWIAEHPHDDAFHVLWFSVTHDPHPPGRAAPPFVLGASGLEYNQRTLDETWRNLLATVDETAKLMDGAREQAPGAQRLWLFATDHGRSFTPRTTQQPIWLAPSTVWSQGSSHCCLASFEEAETPYAVLYDGAARVTPAAVEEPTSTVAVWRLLERAFGVQLELPNTSSYDIAGLTSAPGVPLDPNAAERWAEGMVGSAGDSNAIRAVFDRWAYRSLMIRPQTGKLFAYPRKTQLALTGTPHRGDYFLAEELYNRVEDPYEQHNLADQQEAVVLQFRRKVADWHAVYYDPPSHPRYEYTLAFPHAVSIAMASPSPIRVAVDGAAPSEQAAYRVALTGSRFVIQADGEGTSIIDLEGAGVQGLMRCAATGLPLERLSSEKVRINLALARTNCVATEGDAPLGPEDVSFRAKLVKEAIAGTGGGLTNELVEGLRSWGYVRDLDQGRGRRP
jgi:hypothetical protein